MLVKWTWTIENVFTPDQFMIRHHIIVSWPHHPNIFTPYHFGSSKFGKLYFMNYLNNSNEGIDTHKVFYVASPKRIAGQTDVLKGWQVFPSVAAQIWRRSCPVAQRRLSCAAFQKKARLFFPPLMRSGEAVFPNSNSLNLTLLVLILVWEKHFILILLAKFLYWFHL